MNKCLRDEELLCCYLKEASEPQRAHLHSCTVCTKRYRKLAGDMELMGKVLRATPPPHAAVNRRPVSFRFVAAATAALLVFTLGWSIGQRSGQPRSTNVPAYLLWESQGAATLPFAQGQPASILGEAAADDVSLPSQDFYVAYLQDSIGARNACSAQDFSFSPDCF